jgi:hypothetical protein
MLIVCPLSSLVDIYLIFSASRSFSSRDFEVKLAFFLWNCTPPLFLWTTTPLIYDRHWYAEEKQSKRKFVFVMFTICISVCITMMAFRKLRRGFQKAFALRPDIEAIVRIINRFLVINVLLLAVFIPFGVIGSMSREKEHRQVLLYIYIGAWLVPLTTAMSASAWFSTIALQTLPNTSQSSSLRTAIQKNINDSKSFICIMVYAIISLIVVGFFLYDFIWFIVLLNGVITFAVPASRNVLYIASRLSSARLSSKRRRIHVMPSDYTAKTLHELEADGRVAFSTDAPEVQPLPSPLQSSAWRSELQQSGEEREQKNEQQRQQQGTIAGVSFACLQMFASENNIAPDMTLAQVCARVIKAKTSFTPRKMELPALNKRMEVQTKRNSHVRRLSLSKSSPSRGGQRGSFMLRGAHSTKQRGASAGAKVIHVEDLELERQEVQGGDHGGAESSCIEAEENDGPSDLCISDDGPSDLCTSEPLVLQPAGPAGSVHCSYARLLGAGTDDRGRPLVAKANYFFRWAPP